MKHAARKVRDARYRSRAEVAAAQTGLVPLAAPVELELLRSAREPRVSDEQRSDNLAELWALPGCTTKVERLRVCRQAPHLATLPNAVLRERLQRLAGALNINAAKAACMARRRPHLVTLTFDRLRANVDFLTREVFSGSVETTATAAHTQPA